MSSQKTILHVVGARPNFMKAAPVWEAIRAQGLFRQVLIHTGQHYDENMSDVFFRQLGLPRPDVNLEVGSESHAVQTANVMTKFEALVLKDCPDMVVVYGDVNSTIATALVSAKLGIPVAHVEAGLRSFDMSMPEEVNRVLTDRISTLYFTPSRDGDENLLREGVAKEKIHFVGNVMIDTLIRLLPQAQQRWAGTTERLKLAGGWEERFALVTLHRPSNVDDPATLQSLIQALSKISRQIPLIFPVHPRTRQNIKNAGLDTAALRLVEPVGYLDFLALQSKATLVVTDSGGIQEETTYLGVPCLTLRSNTERPVTITQGTNILIGNDLVALENEVGKVLAGKRKSFRVPEYWDGHASERIATILEEHFQGRVMHGQ